MTHIVSDLKYAWRGLRKTPVFTAVAIFSIALGIGANTAIFTLVDQVLLRLLPVKNPQELVSLTSRGAHYGNSRGSNVLSYPMYEDFRDRNQVFSGTFCRNARSAHISFGDRTERVTSELVSGSYFSVLGVTAARGRLIAPEDDERPGGHPVVVLSHSYWDARFGADPAIVGSTVRVNGHAFTVIGVAQDGFDGIDIGEASQVYVPMMMQQQMTQWNGLDDRRSRWVNVFGRLKPGISAEQAKAGLQPLFHAILTEEVKDAAFARASSDATERFLQMTIDVLPGSQGRSSRRSQLQQPLWVLMAIVGGVLLIACANVANLLLARGMARQREMALRLALGATRRRVMSQLLVEGLLLALLGAAVGLVLATVGARALLGFFATGEERILITATPDVRILAFTLAVSIVTGVLFSLAPAIQSTRPALAPTLKDHAGSVLGGGHVRLRKGLVVVQIALSLLLLIGAGLFLRSLHALSTLNPGFRVDNVLAFGLDPMLNGYDQARTRQFYRDLFERLRRTPGITSAAFTVIPVLEGSEWDARVTVEGYQPKSGENMNPYVNAISPGYFATMKIPMIAGRDFDERDERTTPVERGGPPPFRVAIVNESFAKKHFGSSSALGRHFGFGGDPGTPTSIEIVGVVRDSKYADMREEPVPQLFVPYLENEPTWIAAYVRTSQAPEAMSDVIRRTVQSLDSSLPLIDLRTLERQVERSLVNERLVASLSSVFSLLATLLAMIGLYGVMAYTVTRRTREIGIRMALGAVGRNVVWLILREVVVLVSIGLALGLPAAWALGRIVKAQLYGITTQDPVTIATAIIGLILVAGIAALVPARRAAQIAPTRALRYE